MNHGKTEYDVKCKPYSINIQYTTSIEHLKRSSMGNLLEDQKRLSRSSSLRSYGVL
jgi:hypothetical protein